MGGGQVSSGRLHPLQGNFSINGLLTADSIHNYVDVFALLQQIQTRLLDAHMSFNAHQDKGILVGVVTGQSRFDLWREHTKEFLFKDAVGFLQFCERLGIGETVGERLSKDFGILLGSHNGDIECCRNTGQVPGCLNNALHLVYEGSKTFLHITEKQEGSFWMKLSHMTCC